jgi:septum formation protein
VARGNAERKARAVAGPRHPFVLGVDTVVALDGRIYGKPRDAAHAAETLRALSGRTHQVVSGLALAREGEVRADVDVTDVTFRTLDPATVDWYVEQAEWEGRAGGYAIQGRGAVLVRRISGDYLNVVGLPVAKLVEIVPDLIRPPR